MRLISGKAALGALIAAVAVLGFSGTSAEAQIYGGYGGGGYPGVYGGGYPGVYGGGYQVPSYQYYGNGGHDAQPHGHIKQTPFGNFSYFGNGRHDFRPHGHNETPYGITSYSNGPFSSTQSYSPPAPYYVYRPW